MKKLIRCIYHEACNLSDEEIRNFNGGKILVWYGFNNYSRNLTHINELKKIILQEYPETRDEDIEVFFIENSRVYARHTMLTVAIPVEDFIRLRANDEIYYW